MANLRILKLSTGEEIIGDIVEETTKYRIENPCSLGIAHSPNGQPRLNMMPMLIFSEQKVVDIEKHHVLYNVSVAIEIKNKYNEIYGSGIVVPTKSSIIT